MVQHVLTAGSDQRSQSFGFGAIQIKAPFSQRLSSRQLSADDAASEDDEAEPPRQTGVASIEESIADGRSEQLELQRNDINLLQERKSEL